MEPLRRDGIRGDPVSSAMKRRRKSGRRGFSLVELLVAMAVLALLMVLLLQVAGHTLQASRVTTQQLDATQSAREALDVLTSDLAHGVLTEGAAILYQATPLRLAFLTRGRGPGGTPSRFLAVDYQLGVSGNEAGHLLRSYAAVPWTNADLPGAAAAASGGTEALLAEGILQWSIQAVLDDGSVSTLANLPASAHAGTGSNYAGKALPSDWSALVPSVAPVDAATPRVRALRVAIAAVDVQNFALLNEAQRRLFPQPANADAVQDPVAYWEGILRNSTLPVSARSAIRFHSKTLPLP